MRIVYDYVFMITDYMDPVFPSHCDIRCRFGTHAWCGGSNIYNCVPGTEVGMIMSSKEILALSLIFSSPELKAQVSFSDRPFSSIRLSCRPSVNFYIFNFYSRTTGPILTRLCTNQPWVEGIQVCSNEGNIPPPRGDNSKRVKMQ
jgi:hypothetical protein